MSFNYFIGLGLLFSQKEKPRPRARGSLPAQQEAFYSRPALQGGGLWKDITLGQAGLWRERALAENPSFIQSKSHRHSEPQFPACEWVVSPTSQDGAGDQLR